MSIASVVTATIRSQGQEMDPKYEILSIDITKEVNRIPTGQLVLLDGDAAQREFAISNTGFFEPGKEIEIQLRYEGEPDATVFKGLVVRHGIEGNLEGSLLTIEMKDAAIKLTRPRKSTIFRDQTDTDIIGRIIQKAGLTTGKMVSTKPKHQQIVQYACTDWDFILSRADINGFLVILEDGTFSLREIHEIKAASRPKHTFEYGVSDIYNFEIEIDSFHQHGTIESVGWDVKNQKQTRSMKAMDFRLSQGNLDGRKLAQKIGFDNYTLSHAAAVDPQELQALADARMARSRMSMIRGRLSFPGMANIKPLDVIEVSGIGARFNGLTYVSGIRHRITEQGWQTDLQFGLSPEWFCRQPDIQDVPAAGLLPAVSGLQIGIVDKFEKDPENEFRVKVLLPALDHQAGSVWARMATPEAGKGRGYFFRPEAGDEVVVGFFNDDPRQPVILGAMYGSKNSPPESFHEPSSDNIDKGIVTKTGIRIGLNDEKKQVCIQTPKENKILVDDEAKAISVKDQHGNELIMNQEGITLKSEKDIKLQTKKNVEIQGAKVDVK